ncbi:hypothetical protein B0H13DRAFT_1884640 [Mycena leptocephala]|nr:hypothetical protein B0H13DRAFT_1884640 [Mycena leptocephala]
MFVLERLHPSASGEAITRPSLGQHSASTATKVCRGKLPQGDSMDHGEQKNTTLCGVVAPNTIAAVTRIRRFQERELNKSSKQLLGQPAQLVGKGRKGGMGGVGSGMASRDRHDKEIKQYESVDDEGQDTKPGSRRALDTREDRKHDGELGWLCLERKQSDRFRDQRGALLISSQLKKDEDKRGQGLMAREWGEWAKKIKASNGRRNGAKKSREYKKWNARKVRNAGARRWPQARLGHRKDSDLGLERVERARNHEDASLTQRRQLDLAAYKRDSECESETTTATRARLGRRRWVLDRYGSTRTLLWRIRGCNDCTQLGLEARDCDKCDVGNDSDDGAGYWLDKMQDAKRWDDSANLNLKKAVAAQNNAGTRRDAKTLQLAGLDRLGTCTLALGQERDEKAKSAHWGPHRTRKVESVRRTATGSAMGLHTTWAATAMEAKLVNEVLLAVTQDLRCDFARGTWARRNELAWRWTWERRQRRSATTSTMVAAMTRDVGRRRRVGTPKQIRACNTMRDEATSGKYDFSVCVTLTKPNTNICGDQGASCDESMTRDEAAKAASGDVELQRMTAAGTKQGESAR